MRVRETFEDMLLFLLR